MKILILLASIVLFLMPLSTAYAAGDSTCQPVYGGGEVCQENIKFTINKMVQTQGKGGSFVENLTMNDAHFAPNSNINFKVVIKNTGDRDITNLNVVDTFPDVLNYVSGFSNSSASGNKVSFIIPKLEKGKSAEYIVITKADASKLPANQAITCVVNKVTAASSDGTTGSDEAGACIEKSIAKPTPQVEAKPQSTNIPATGPEVGILIGLVSSGAIGFYLRKRIN